MKKLILFVLMIMPLSSIFAENRGYYRFPVLHGETIVFTAEGDLWTVSVHGGIAQRLTTHHGMESHAAISPDGKVVAFSGQYEGPTEVYTMPIHGGIPIRLTYEGSTAIVIGWTPDGRVLYSSQKYSTLPNTQLVTIHPGTHIQELVTLSQASDGAYDSSGSTLFFTRLAFQGSQTKRYMGGTVQNIWKFSEGDEEAIPLTVEYAGTSKQPMVFENRVYFASDRDGTMNIWSMKENGEDLKQHTFHKGWDVNQPCLCDGQIVYQRVADIYLQDIFSGK